MYVCIYITFRVKHAMCIFTVLEIKAVYIRNQYPYTLLDK